jgi:hypothetical protein
MMITMHQREDIMVCELLEFDELIDVVLVLVEGVYIV